MRTTLMHRTITSPLSNLLPRIGVLCIVNDIIKKIDRVLISRNQTVHTGLLLDLGLSEEWLGLSVLGDSSRNLNPRLLSSSLRAECAVSGCERVLGIHKNVQFQAALRIDEAL